MYIQRRVKGTNKSATPMFFNCWRCWFDVDLGRALCGGCVNKEIWRTLSLPPINKFVDELFWVETTYVFIVSYLEETNLNPNFFVGCPVHLMHHIFSKKEEEKKGVASSATQCATNSYMESVLLRIWSNLKQFEMQIRFQPEIGKPTWRNTGFFEVSTILLVAFSNTFDNKVFKWWL